MPLDPSCVDEDIKFALAEGEWPFETFLRLCEEKPGAWVSAAVTVEMFAALEAAVKETHEWMLRRFCMAKHHKVSFYLDLARLHEFEEEPKVEINEALMRAFGPDYDPASLEVLPAEAVSEPLPSDVAQVNKLLTGGGPLVYEHLEDEQKERWDELSAAGANPQDDIAYVLDGDDGGLTPIST